MVSVEDESRSCFVVWWYGSGYFCFPFQTDVGSAECFWEVCIKWLEYETDLESKCTVCALSAWMTEAAVTCRQSRVRANRVPNVATQKVGGEWVKVKGQGAQHRYKVLTLC